MLATRRNDISPAILNLSYHKLITDWLTLRYDISAEDFYSLLCAYTIQHETNDLVSLKLMRLRTGEDPTTIWRRFKRLCPKYLDFVSLNGYNRHKYNVNQAGEYLIRSYQTELNRILNDTPLSRWKKLKKGCNDKRERFLRKAAVKGAKLY